MTIGFITPEYPNAKVKHAAGIGTSISNLALALVKKNVKVLIFVYHQDTNEVINSEGVEIHLIISKKFPILGGYFSRKNIQNYINNVVEKEEIDILEAPDWSGITAYMRFRIPLIIRLHGSDAYFCKLENRKQKLKNKMFERSALNNATAFIAPTIYAGKETARIFNLDSKKIKIIHNGLQIENFNNQIPEKFDENTILYIGTIIRKKGVFELAQIFNKVVENNQEARLLLIGSDSPDLKTGSNSTYKLVEKLFSNKSLKQVNYLGKISYKEVIKHIKNAHVCAFPSFAESFGMVTIESMALKKPVVNTNIGWAQELIDDGVNGFLVHPLDIELYAKKIALLLEDKALCLKMGSSARIKIQSTFNIDKIADVNIEYYKRFIAK